VKYRCLLILVFSSLKLRAQDNYEIQVYGSETVEKGKTMVELPDGSIKLADDADDVRYDTDADKIYVGYGTGGIAIIDAISPKQVSDIALPAHPESFQLDAKINKLWVNLPGSGIVGVADLKQLKLTAKWSKLLPRANFPMAYDEV
jgi:hypothetical protein